MDRRQHPAYLKRFGTPQSLDDLAAHRCITFDGLEASNAWTFADVDGQKQQVKVRSRMAVSTAEAAIEAAALGLGLTRVLSYQVATALQDGRLVRVLVGKESPAVPASLIYPGQGRLPMKTRAFIDFAVGRLRDRLSALDHAGAPGPSLPVTPVRGRRRRLQR